MEFPTPEIEQELQRIRAALITDKSKELRFIGVNASSLQLFLLSQATLIEDAQIQSATIFADLLASHSKLAEDLKSAADMGLI